MKVGYLRNEEVHSHCQSLSPFFDDVIQTIYRLVVLQSLRTTPFPATKGARQLLGKSFMLPQLFKNRLVSEICDIFCVIKRSRG